MATSFQWLQKMKRRAVVATRGGIDEDTEFDEHMKNLKKLEKQLQSVKRQANQFIKTKREANKNLTRLAMEMRGLLSDKASPNVKSASSLVSRVRGMFDEKQEQMVFERTVLPIQKFLGEFPTVFKCLTRRKELLVTFQYYKKMHQEAEQARARHNSDGAIADEKHRAEQFMEAKHRFEMSHKAAIRMVRKIQGKRVELLRDTIETLSAEEARLGKRASDGMSRVLAEVASDDEVERAFRRRSDSMNDGRTISARGDGSVFGAPLPNHPHVSVVVRKCVSYLRDCAMKHCGLFRVPGEVMLVNKIRDEFEKGKSVDIADSVRAIGNSGIDVVATLLKLYLRELPDPLFPYTAYGTILSSQDDSVRSKKEQIEILTHAMSDPKLTPPQHAVTIALLVDFLGDVMANKDENKMTPQNLAVCLAPSIMKSRDGGNTDDPMSMMNEMTKARSALSMMLTHRDEIFSEDVMEAARKALYADGRDAPSPPPRTRTPPRTPPRKSSTTPNSPRPTSFLWEGGVEDDDEDDDDESEDAANEVMDLFDEGYVPSPVTPAERRLTRGDTTAVASSLSEKKKTKQKKRPPALPPALPPRNSFSKP